MSDWVEGLSEAASDHNLIFPIDDVTIVQTRRRDIKPPHPGVAIIGR